MRSVMASDLEQQYAHDVDGVVDAKNMDDNMSWDIDEVSSQSNDTASERRGEDGDDTAQVCVCALMCVCIHKYRFLLEQ